MIHSRVNVSRRPSGEARILKKRWQVLSNVKSFVWDNVGVNRTSRKTYNFDLSNADIPNSAQKSPRTDINDDNYSSNLHPFRSHFWANEVFVVDSSSQYLTGIEEKRRQWNIRGIRGCQSSSMTSLHTKIFCHISHEVVLEFMIFERA